jgi:phosphoglucosamine mutase
VVIGRDTRASGHYLELAITAGLVAAGVDVDVLGVVPTSAVAHFVKSHGAMLGIMVSASHNPHHDNGLKVFDPLGFKITEALERILEEDYQRYDELALVVNEAPGNVRIIDDARAHYAKMVLKDGDPLDGMTIVIDCAHGAASGLAREIFVAKGAQVISIGDHAPGKDINRDCGSEAPLNLKRAVIAAGADLGIAFDGDADRVIFVDEKGEILDGDAVLALMAIDHQRAGRLARNTLVATIMSNMALDNALKPHGIVVVRTNVGDKLVARAMKEGGFTFGGENSGHMISFPEATTGDGLVSALRLANILKRAARPASTLTSFFSPTPKILRNFVIDEKLPLDRLPRTTKAIADANQILSDNGRVMFRYSGTENKARLLVEAPTDRDCERLAKHIGDIYLAELQRSFTS